MLHSFHVCTRESQQSFAVSALKHHPLIGREFTKLTKQASQQDQGIHLSLSPQHWNYKSATTPSFYIWVLGITSGLPAWACKKIHFTNWIISLVIHATFSIFLLFCYLCSAFKKLIGFIYLLFHLLCLWDGSLMMQPRLALLLVKTIFPNAGTIGMHHYAISYFEFFKAGTC